MPDVSTLETPACCCVCNNILLSYVRFQWGAVPNNSYSLGENVRWLREGGGRIKPPFSIVFFGTEYYWNYGNPESQKVLALDLDIYEPQDGLECSKCGASIGAAIISISNNRIVGVETATGDEIMSLLGPSYGRADTLTMTDGHWVPREDWFDHPMIEASEARGEYVE